MIVWSDTVDDIIPATLDIEGRLLKLVWKQRPGSATPGAAGSLSRTSMFGSASRMSLARTKAGDIELAEKGSAGEAGTPDSASDREKELEEGAAKPAPRPTRILMPIYIGLATALTACEFCL